MCVNKLNKIPSITINKALHSFRALRYICHHPSNGFRHPPEIGYFMFQKYGIKLVVNAFTLTIRHCSKYCKDVILMGFLVYIYLHKIIAISLKLLVLSRVLFMIINSALQFKRKFREKKIRKNYSRPLPQKHNANIPRMFNVRKYLPN